MIELAITGLEKTINAYCRLDPETINRLKALEGKVIQCDITDWDAHFYILPYDNGLHLTKNHQSSVDTTISGTLNSLMRVGCQKGSSKAATKNNVIINGNTEVAQSIQDVLSSINIDWEEHLSKLVGDTLAHQVGWRTRQAISAGKEIIGSFKQSLSEFLHHETPNLPTEKECEQFYQQVADIKNDVERAEMRIQRLQVIKKND